MDKNTTKEGAITLDDAYDAHNHAIQALRKIKAARKGRKFQMVKIGFQIWKEIEVTNTNKT